jgi:hypothetical protein
MVLPLVPNEGSTAPQAYPFININTNKVEYLTIEQAEKRDDVRHIRPGETITPDQMSDTPVTVLPPSSS